MSPATTMARPGTTAWLATLPPVQPGVPAPFVTISRLAGSGGRALALAVAQALTHERPLAGPSGWQVHDSDLCQEIAAEPALASRLEDLAREVYRPGLEEFLGEVPRPDGQEPIPLDRIFRTVRALAALGNGVILGRGGVMLTRDLPLGVHLRLIAPREVRLARMQEEFGLSRGDAQLALDQQDYSRARLFSECFGRDIDDPLLYDAVFNTARVEVETIAAATVELVRARYATRRS